MGYVLIGSPEDVSCIEEGTSILFRELFPENAEKNLKIHVNFKDEDTLTVKKSGEEIRIFCKEPAHFFRGLNWALHQADKDVCEKTEPVCFRKDGFMLDCSRNSVYTVNKVKSVIRRLARMGMNLLMLYTEDTYEVPEQPYFGAYRGRYSQAEIREMDAYAKIFGVELIPCIQTLAHLRNALKWPMGNEIRDNGDILLVGEEKVYTLIEQMLRFVKNSFSTRRVHLGMDEAIELGLGEYLRKNGYRHSSELIKEHTSRVFEICKKLGLEPMMWSDMFITANTGQNYYDSHDLSDTSHWVKPEEGLGLIYWDYYNDNPAVYENMIHTHKLMSENIVFADGMFADFWLLEKFDTLFLGEKCNMTADNPSKYLLYQDMMLGMFDYHIQGMDTAAYYGEMEKKLRECQSTSPAHKELFGYYACLAGVLAKKGNLGLRIKDAYDKKNYEGLKDICSGRAGTSEASVFCCRGKGKSRRRNRLFGKSMEQDCNRMRTD